MSGEGFFAPPVDSEAIRASAKDEPCLIRLPLVCNDDPATTVLCHGRKYPGGGGASIKPDDLGGAYGCYACHCVVDGHVPLPDWLTREQVVRAFHDGHVLTLRRLRMKGLVVASGETMWDVMDGAIHQECLTDKQIAHYLGVTRDTVWRWVRTEVMPPPIRLGPNCTRWRIETIKSWLDGKAPA